MARLPLLDPTDLPADRRSLLETMADEGDDDGADHDLGGEPLELFRALAHDPDLLERFQSYATTLRREGGLSALEREFVILATAHAVGSSYEWHQHVRVGLNEGLSPAQIRAVSADDLDALAPANAELVEYVRRFVGSSVDDDAHRRLADHHGEQAVLSVGLLAGLYLGLARLIDALDVDVEGEFVGWDLERL